MREIKFRFWGAFKFDNNDDPVYSMLYGDEFAFNDYLPINELFANDSCKVMQYIGIKDSKGQEI